MYSLKGTCPDVPPLDYRGDSCPTLQGIHLLSMFRILGCNLFSAWGKVICCYPRTAVLGCAAQVRGGWRGIRNPENSRRDRNPNRRFKWQVDTDGGLLSGNGTRVAREGGFQGR